MMMIAMNPNLVLNDRLMVVPTEYSSASWVDEL